MTEDRRIYRGRDDKLVPVTHVRVVFVFDLVNLKFYFYIVYFMFPCSVTVIILSLCKPKV